jgi:chaperonin cofactor prefoldin
LSTDIAKLQQLLYEYNAVRNEIVALRARIAELRTAKRILEEKKPRSVFRSVGGLMIEIGLDDAMRYIDDELEVAELKLKRLEEQEKKLVEAIRELEKKIGLAAPA